MEIRPITQAERKYTYAQSTQLQGQTGSIGYLRGDFARTGKDFFTTWFDHRKNLKTDDFRNEFDTVINSLRSGGLLQNRSAMLEYATMNPKSSFKGNYCTEYGFRVDTEKHCYLLRCNPTIGDYNFYCFSYIKEWLDKHMDKADKGIRFINSNYKELFRIPDGDKIAVTVSWGERFEHTCRYIDEYHLEVSTGKGSDLFHICEFAERMERNNATYEPMKAEPLNAKTQKNREHER